MDYMPDAVERDRRERLALGPTCTCKHLACEHAAGGTGRCMRLVSKDPYKACKCKAPKYGAKQRQSR